ncbi:flagellar motor protein MotB [Xaviernesmea oryzae]|uniref:Flagellar motor protein MotB n=1 Tax=Xaviernesmea oryzae TaxID=464029 RepID=A0A1Q9ARU2_9HYPH|nr:MotB family protein [Xaviernesmea oryzae]OLP58173.1 flagellar motor protein MotB [Xaviernesmea oryzae]SEL80135.1 chemotaxis protein MotB [Xaviernesmea oryzae]
MSDDNHHGKNEIIIIKKHGGGHGGAHGGAWKIAYADFMTAMMAFFLVMWLINASNEKTKKAIASYFNPVQLTESKPAEKGIKQPAKDAKGEETQSKSKVDGDQPKTGGTARDGTDQSATSGEETQYSDADFFENPYAVLSEIARESGKEANISSKGDGGAQTAGPATGASGGEAYRDPFDPDFWSKQVAIQNAGNAKQGAEVTKDSKQLPPGTGLAQAAAVDIAMAQPTDGKAKPAATAEAGKDAQAAQADAAKSPEQKSADALKGELQQALSGGAAGKLAEGLIVTPTEGGLLVSISEQSDVPMFQLGSAVPEKVMVEAMEKIGKVLGERKGAVAIRGHTDARPFKKGYDNWRLSSDRAQSAFYMLVRGGLDEKRITQVSGFAATRPQVPDDPMAPANRRIEILLQTDQG